MAESKKVGFGNKPDLYFTGLTSIELLGIIDLTLLSTGLSKYINWILKYVDTSLFALNNAIIFLAVYLEIKN